MCTVSFKAARRIRYLLLYFSLYFTLVFTCPKAVGNIHVHSVSRTAVRLSVCLSLLALGVTLHVLADGLRCLTIDLRLKDPSNAPQPPRLALPSRCSLAPQASHLGLVCGSQPTHHFFNVALLRGW